MANKKIITSAVAIATAAVLATGGTFAWQSINQRAINEASDVVNPGGRLHDDFDGTNKDVYVENFADNDIFARVRLEEYMEVVMNKGTDAEVTKVIYGDRTESTEGEVTRTPAVHVFAVTDKNDDGTFKAPTGSDEPYWNWTMGSTTSEDAYYMPTFNKNKDSLVADTNGIYEEGNIGTISKRDGSQYTEYTEYAEGQTKTDTEIYDGDTNNIDEVGTDFDNLTNYADNIKTVESVTHTAAKIGDTKGLISMEEWLALGTTYSEDTHGDYWVYDTDGWVYWSSPIAKGETTGRLLDSIELSEIMDDTWYYRIDVVGQFVTANDSGKADGTGFYDTVNGTVPSENAEKLLEMIGVEYTKELTLASSVTSTEYPFVVAKIGESVKISNTDSTSELSVRALNNGYTPYNEWKTSSELPLKLSMDEHCTYKNGMLTVTALNPGGGEAVIPESQGHLLCVESGENVGFILVNDDGILDRNQGNWLDAIECEVGSPVAISSDWSGQITTVVQAKDAITGDRVEITSDDFVIDDSGITIKKEDFAGKIMYIYHVSGEAMGVFRFKPASTPETDFAETITLKLDGNNLRIKKQDTPVVFEDNSTYFFEGRDQVFVYVGEESKSATSETLNGGQYTYEYTAGDIYMDIDNRMMTFKPKTTGDFEIKVVYGSGTTYSANVKIVE